MEWWKYAVILLAVGALFEAARRGRRALREGDRRAGELARQREDARYARSREAAEAEEKAAEALRREHAAAAAQMAAADRAFRLFIGDFPRFGAAVDEGLDCEGVALDYLSRLLGERLRELLPETSPVSVLGVDYDTSETWKAMRRGTASAPTPEALLCHREVRLRVDQLGFASPSGLPWPDTLRVTLEPVQYLRDPGGLSFVGSFLRVNLDGHSYGYPDTVVILSYGPGSIRTRYVDELDGPSRLDDDGEGA